MDDSDTTLSECQLYAIIELCCHAICEIGYLCFTGQAKRAGLLADGIHNIIKMPITGGSVSQIKTELSYYHDQYGNGPDYHRFDYMKYLENPL
jgi:hypothetical protein